MALLQEPSVVLVLSMVETTHGFITRTFSCSRVEYGTDYPWLYHKNLQVFSC